MSKTNGKTQPKSGPAAKAELHHRSRPIDVHIGMRLRGARIAKGLSQTEAGALVGVTFQQIQKYESGRNRISSACLQQFGSALDKQVAWFFEGAPGFHDTTTDSIDPVVCFAATREGLQFIEAFNKIDSADMRRALVELAVIHATTQQAKRKGTQTGR